MGPRSGRLGPSWSAGRRLVGTAAVRSALPSSGESVPRCGRICSRWSPSRLSSSRRWPEPGRPGWSATVPKVSAALQTLLPRGVGGSAGGRLASPNGVRRRARSGTGARRGRVRYQGQRSAPGSCSRICGPPPDCAGRPSSATGWMSDSAGMGRGQQCALGDSGSHGRQVRPPRPHGSYSRGPGSPSLSADNPFGAGAGSVSGASSEASPAGSSGWTNGSGMRPSDASTRCRRRS